jgi:hypothetical protein
VDVYDHREAREKDDRGGAMRERRRLTKFLLQEAAHRTLPFSFFGSGFEPVRAVPPIPGPRTGLTDRFCLLVEPWTGPSVRIRIGSVRTMVQNRTVPPLDKTWSSWVRGKGKGVALLVLK